MSSRNTQLQEVKDIVDAKKNEAYFYNQQELKGYTHTDSTLADMNDVYQASQNLDFFKKQTLEGFNNPDDIYTDPNVVPLATQNTKQGMEQADTAGTLLGNATSGAAAVEDKLTMARALYQHQAMIGQVAGNNQKMMERNLDTLKRAYIIQRYEEEKNNDRRRIISNLSILLLLLIIVVILYKNNIVSISFVYTSFLVVSLTIGFYLSYQYYYDYYVRDQVFYKERRFAVNQENKETGVCPTGPSQ